MKIRGLGDFLTEDGEGLVEDGRIDRILKVRDFGIVIFVIYGVLKVEFCL